MTTGNPATASADSASVRAQWLSPPTPPVERMIDAARVRELVADYEGLAVELIDLFASSTPELLGELRAAVSAGEDSAVRGIAHKLKGGCQNIGAVSMAALCESLEQDRGDGARAAALAELETALPETIRELRAAV